MRVQQLIHALLISNVLGEDSPHVSIASTDLVSVLEETNGQTTTLDQMSRTDLTTSIEEMHSSIRTSDVDITDLEVPHSLSVAQSVISTDQSSTTVPILLVATESSVVMDNSSMGSLLETFSTELQPEGSITLASATNQQNTTSVISNKTSETKVSIVMYSNVEATTETTTETLPVPASTNGTTVEDSGVPNDNTTYDGTLSDTMENANKTDQDDDPESHFMSFEEWKKQKVGNDLPPAKKMKTHDGKIPVKAVNQNLNAAMGEDMEIDLGMFTGSRQDEDGQEEGGKIYKDRFNYASFDCAATIVKTNSEAKGASSILNENKDSYLLNECGAPSKFVTIELCQDILVDTVLIGNYEFFSSTFKKIRLSVSDRFPVPINGWTVLGEFEADNVRALQTFNVKNPLIWARYLRLEILSHYGNEYYCPLSVIRVHGQTMIDEFKNEEEAQEAQKDEEVSILQQESTSIEMAGNITSQEKYATQETFVVKGNNTVATFEASVVDLDRINTLNEECAVYLPHLGIEKFLEELQSTDKEVCEEIENLSVTIPVETKEPTTQESIYKNIVKRLSLLESNASLSLLYIEEQSKLLSTAFTKLEKRQTTKFDLLVAAFNESMNSQIQQMQNMYTDLYQETASILASQRRAHTEWLFESSKKISSISSELTFFRRLAVFNTIFITCLLVYVVATRETYIETEYIEDDQFWHDDFNSSPTDTPNPPGSPISPAGSFLDIEKTNKRKKKIKFSVSHKFSNSVSNINTGSFYIDSDAVSAAVVSGDDDSSFRHRRSVTSSFDGNSVNSDTVYTDENQEEQSDKDHPEND